MSDASNEEETRFIKIIALTESVPVLLKPIPSTLEYY